MQTEFTKEFMRNNSGCYSEEQLDRCSFMSTEPVTLESILNSEISIKDKYWFVCKKSATKEENQQIAIGVAELILYIYERKYPDDKRPREAIRAARDYLAGIINVEEFRIKKHAAYAAYAAADAYAAYAAYAAVADAYAADDAYAAYAAYAAADAADAAALQKFLLNFCLEPAL